ALRRSASTGRFDQDDASPSPTHPFGLKPVGLTGGGSSGGAASGGLSTPTGRSAVEGSPTGGGGGSIAAAAAAAAGGPWTGPSAEALFVRLLAEVLRWLEAPAAEDSGIDGPTGRKAAAGGPLSPLGAGSGGSWYSWLASQKVRLTSQMAQIEGAVMAGGSGGKGTQHQQQHRERTTTPKASGEDVGDSWRSSDPGSGFLLTQQMVVHTRNA
ncbi:hypothetical protein VaNZ11_016037, partial [Volvox africanus]